MFIKFSLYNLFCKIIQEMVKVKFFNLNVTYMQGYSLGDSLKSPDKPRGKTDYRNRPTNDPWPRRETSNPRVYRGGNCKTKLIC